MGWNDHLYDNVETEVTCSHCGRKYLQWTEEQVPGFRERDYDYCPYCGESNGSSMDEEYHNRKLEDK